MLTFQCFSADSCTAFREAALSVRASGTRYSPCKFGIQPPTVLLWEYCFADDDCIVNSEFSGWGGVEAFLSRTFCPLLPRRLRALSAVSCRLFLAAARRALRGSTPNYSVIIRCNNNDNWFIFNIQRLGGVEPLHQAWEARILPLYYSRVGKNHHS